MKRRCLFVTVVGLLVAADTADEAVKKDLKKLQGRWTLVSAIVDGKPIPADVIKDVHVVIEGEKYTYDGAVKREMTITFDPTKNPKEIDLTQRKGEQRKTSRAIYEVDGNTLKVCRHQDGAQARPTSFTSKPGSGWSSSVWKREKR